MLNCQVYVQSCLNSRQHVLVQKFVSSEYNTGTDQADGAGLNLFLKLDQLLPYYQSMVVLFCWKPE